MEAWHAFFGLGPLCSQPRYYQCRCSGQANLLHHGCLRPSTSYSQCGESCVLWAHALRPLPSVVSHQPTGLETCSKLQDCGMASPKSKCQRTGWSECPFSWCRRAFTESRMAEKARTRTIRGFVTDCQFPFLHRDAECLCIDPHLAFPSSPPLLSPSSFVASLTTPLQTKYCGIHFTHPSKTCRPPHDQ